MWVDDRVRLPAEVSSTIVGRLARLQAIALGLMVHAGVGYRPFPSVDDYAYIPMNWHMLDPSAFPRDLVIQQWQTHLPLWSLFVYVFERTIGLAWGFWGLTLALSVATMWAALRLLTALGVRGFGLLVTLLVFAGSIVGIGRGLHDGAFGQAFHTQWLSLCLLLWSYDSFLRRRDWTAGGLLGLAAVAHPVNGAHGAFVILVATLVTAGPRLRRLTKIGVVCMAVSIPTTLPLVLGFAAPRPSSDWSRLQMIGDGYLFRLIHQFSFDAIVPLKAVALVILFTLGVASALLLAQLKPSGALRAMVGLLIGHTLIILAALIFHGLLPPVSMVPFLLHLTRTSPIWLVLCVMLTAAAVEAITRQKSSVPSVFALMAAILLSVGFMMLTMVRWSAWTHLAAAIGLLGWWLTMRARRYRLCAGLYVASALTALVFAFVYDQRQATVEPEAAELYAWAAQRKPDALFIVPPSCEAFRFYTRRSVYVDFKAFPSSAPWLIPVWRRRLEEVALPDREALGQRGWLGISSWDRTYASRNTPSRIADLLETTGADYFVWDAEGFRIPPHSPLPRDPDPRLEVAFDNARYKAYRRHDAEAR